jgi:hypothetical protein
LQEREFLMGIRRACSSHPHLPRRLLTTGIQVATQEYLGNGY